MVAVTHGNFGRKFTITLKQKLKCKCAQLQSEQRSTKKGDKSSGEFFTRIKTIIDSLLSNGETVFSQEQLDVILVDLPSEFKPIVMLISTRIDWFEFVEVESLLLARGNRVAKQTEVLIAVSTLNLNQATASATAIATSTESAPQMHYAASDQPSRGGTGGGRFGCGGKSNRGRGGRSGHGGRSNVQGWVFSRTGGHDPHTFFK